jgi:hypothetical protein
VVVVVLLLLVGHLHLDLWVELVELGVPTTLRGLPLPVLVVEAVELVMVVTMVVEAVLVVAVMVMETCLIQLSLEL